MQQENVAHLLRYSLQAPAGWLPGSADLAYLMAPFFSGDGTPSFSASTFRAASVGDPTAAKEPFLNSIFAWLHTAQMAAMASKTQMWGGHESHSLVLMRHNLLPILTRIMMMVVVVDMTGKRPKSKLLSLVQLLLSCLRLVVHRYHCLYSIRLYYISEKY